MSRLCLPRARRRSAMACLSTSRRSGVRRGESAAVAGRGSSVAGALQDGLQRVLDAMTFDAGLLVARVTEFGRG